MTTERKNTYREKLMKSLDRSRELTDEEIYRAVDRLLLSGDRKNYIRLKDRMGMRKYLFDSVRRLDVIQELVDDDSVTEIMVNGTEGIYIEREGALTRWDQRFTSREKLGDIVQKIVSGVNRSVNESSPIVDARLENGSRVNIVLPPAAIDGPIITIRRFPDHPIDMQRLISLGSISAEAAQFLDVCVKAGYNIFISGGTGSGKTTFLNALAASVPKDERIVTIEDNAELQIRGVPNLVRLEARAANAEGEHAITIRDLIRCSLRMRPDRIIVGEVRGEEAIDMLAAFGTGHDGSLSTGHGNNPAEMLTRLETMILMNSTIPLPAIRRQIAGGIDICVHLSRLRDRSRKVLEICEIDGFDDVSGEIRMHTLFGFRETGEEDGKVCGSLKREGKLKHTGKLERAGMRLP